MKLISPIAYNVLVIFFMKFYAIGIKGSDIAFCLAKKFKKLIQHINKTK